MKEEIEWIGEKYVYGMDPASKMDFFGIVIHKIPARQFNDKPPMAQLVRLEAVTHTSYLHMMEMFKRELFVKYPPHLIVIDYNTEKTISEVFVRDYGKERVEPINFGNQAKNQLKDDGLAILKQGYRFPEVSLQKDKNQQRLLQTLLKQLAQEQMLMTPSGLITFDHPQGEHNDLAVAWELSIHGCLRLMLNISDGPVAYSVRRKKPIGWGIPDKEIEGPADPLEEIKLNPYNKIKSSNISYK